MLVTPVRSIFSNPVQPENTPSPNAPLGKLNSFKLMQPEKAYSPTLNFSASIVIFFNFSHPPNIPGAI